MRFFVLCLLIGCIAAKGYAFELKIPHWEEGEAIPVEFTCDGEDVSPSLEWHDAPEGSKAFALTCIDPDAPAGEWWHWIVVNIPAGAVSLEMGLEKAKEPAYGIVQGKNDFGRIGYNGACPPAGRPHRYIFTLYALKERIILPEGRELDKNEFRKLIEGKVIAECSYMGRYSR